MIAWQILGQNTWPYVGEKKAKDTQVEFSQADMFKYFQYTGLQLMSKQKNLVIRDKKHVFCKTGHSKMIQIWF